MTKFNHKHNQLFLDVDGVLADFVSYTRTHLFDGLKPPEWEAIHGTDAFWEKITNHDRLYYNLPLMEDAMNLYDAVKHLNPIFLTGCHKQEFSVTTQLLGSEDKYEWTYKHFGPDQWVFTCESKNKSDFCKPGDIIIDDWPKYKPLWEQAGGIWITHTSAENSIQQLKELGVI